MKQRLNTRVLTGGRRGGDTACSLVRSGGGSPWEEWSGRSVLSGMRGKTTAVSRAGRENSEIVAKRY